MSVLLHAEQVTKSFGRFVAVHQVTLDLEAGVLTSIIGPNGAGKTTLINVLTGQLPCDSGRIFLQGEEITHLPIAQRVRKGISRSFQITTVFPRLTVAQNILLAILARQNRSGQPWSRYDAYADSRAEAETLLQQVGLWEKRLALAGTLAHGDQRRLEIGMALASRPRLCFLDEPTAGMNPLERAEILEVIKKLAQLHQVTLVVVEHDMDMVFSISDWIVVMHQGKILTQGTPAAIRNSVAVREVYLGEDEKIEVVVK